MSAMSGIEQVMRNADCRTPLRIDVPFDFVLFTSERRRPIEPVADLVATKFHKF